MHLFAKHSSTGVVGSGAYTLVIDTLPQVVAVEAQKLLPGFNHQPGGPTTSLVLVDDKAIAWTPPPQKIRRITSYAGQDQTQLWVRETIGSRSKRVARGI